MTLKEAGEKFRDILMQLDRPPTLHKDAEGNLYLKIGEGTYPSEEHEDEFNGGDIGDLDDAMG